MLHHAPFLFFLFLFFFIIYWLTWLLFLLRFLSNVFHQSVKKIHMHKFPCKVRWIVYMEKNVPPKRDPGFMKLGYLLGVRVYFHIHRFWFFNRILLKGEISLNRGPFFAGVLFPHLTHFSPVSHFYTPWKVFWRFQGV